MVSQSLSKLKKLQNEALALWEERWVENDGEKITLWQRFVRFWVFVGRSFVRNRCPVRASALAYTTLLALVPLLAVAISISTSFLKSEKGQEEVTEHVNKWITELVHRVAPQLGVQAEGSSVNVQEVVDTINSAIAKIQSGSLGVTAGLLLMFVAISLLNSIESTMNDIWGVSRGRSWITRIFYYWGVITLIPALILTAMSINTGRFFDTTRQMMEQFPIFYSFASFLVPVLILTPTFGLFYYLMPNTRVEWRAARLGGFVAAVLMHLNNQFSVIYFDQVVRNSKIYGGLGTIPVFLIGLYFSWLIVLLGAQVSYAYQNRRSYFQEKQADNINQRGREFVALRIMTFIAKRFNVGDRPPSLTEIAESISVPSRLASKIIEPLLQTKILMEVAGNKAAEVAYTPGRPLEKISFQNILDALRAGMGQEVATAEDLDRASIRGELDKVLGAEQEVASKITLDKIVQTV